MALDLRSKGRGIMKISEIDASSRKVDIEAVVTEKEEPRDITTRRGATKICNAKIEDESGSIKLVLWGEETDKIKQGDKIKIENGYVKEWNGELQLSVGMYGKLTVL